MANFYSGDIETFNALAYSDPHPSTIRYIENNLSRPTHALNAAADRFISAAYETYDNLMGSAAVRRARAVARQVSSYGQKNIIRPLRTVAELQTSPPVMARWLMAEPTVRKMYHQKRVDGFSETYHDVCPGFIKEDHQDYRQVMNGIVEETTDGWEFTQYYDDLDEDDRELEMDEQFDILRSWQTMLNAINVGKDDPTSRWNAEL